MVRTCSAYACHERRTTGRTLKDRISFHSFPKDEAMKHLWVVATRRADFKPTKHSKLCSKHFKDNDFDFYRFGSNRGLQRCAVPSVFDFTDHQTKIVKDKRPAKILLSSAVSKSMEKDNSASAITSSKSGIATSTAVTKSSLRRKTKRPSRVKSLLSASNSADPAPPLPIVRTMDVDGTSTLKSSQTVNAVATAVSPSIGAENMEGNAMSNLKPMPTVNTSSTHVPLLPVTTTTKSTSTMVNSRPFTAPFLVVSPSPKGWIMKVDETPIPPFRIINTPTIVSTPSGRITGVELTSTIIPLNNGNMPLSRGPLLSGPTLCNRCQPSTVVGSTLPVTPLQSINVPLTAVTASQSAADKSTECNPVTSNERTRTINLSRTVDVTSTGVTSAKGPPTTLPGCSQLNMDANIEITNNEIKRKRNCLNPKFVSQCTDSELNNPIKAKRNWKMAMETISNQKKKIKCLQQLTRRLKKKVSNLQELLEHLM